MTIPNKKMNPNMSKNWEKIKMRLGYKCAVSGCNCTTNLQLDHIKPLTKKFNVTSKLSCKWVNLVEEVDKCQFLCQQHHKEKTYNEDWKDIQYKRREFIHESELVWNPLLGEFMQTVTFDLHKKGGKEFYEEMTDLAKLKNISVEEAYKEAKLYGIELFKNMEKYEEFWVKNYPDIWEKRDEIKQRIKKMNDSKT
tara:strand:+ start:237 stop:821 length:585 start_codon:yes stop_codon:yes gene_type:complete